MISIITPCFNSEAFIEHCIRSVLDQECSSVEHIIIDGGSSDNTTEIVRYYAEKHPHIRWISEEDNGQSDAMNKGVEMADGEILGFLNVDDFYEPNVLNRVLEIFQSLSAPSFVVGNCKIWNDNNELTGLNKPKKIEFKDLLMGFHANPFPMNPSAYFYTKSLHEQVGLYDVDDHYTMDLDFILRVVRAGEVHYFDEIWGNYQMIQGSKTMTDTARNTSRDRVEEILKKYRKTISGYEGLKTESLYQIFRLRRSIKWYLIHRRDELRSFFR